MPKESTSTKNLEPARQRLGRSPDAVFASTLCAWVLIFLVLVSGCATPDSGREQVAEVSEKINQRTGFTLRQNREPGHSALPPGIDITGGLSRREAVAVALWNNAAFEEALTDLGFAEADLIEASRLPDPTLILFFPWGPKQLEFAVKYPIEALWQRERRIEVATDDAQRIAETLAQNGLDLIRDVSRAYTEAKLIRERARLATENLSLAEQTLELAEARIRAGDATEIEAATARTDVLVARQTVESLPQDAAIAREKLANLLGIELAAESVLTERGWTTFYVPTSADSLLADALAARPDLRAAEIGIEGATRKVGLERTFIGRFLAVLDANNDGSDFEAGPGLEWDVPIFHQNQSKIARAKAELDRASKRYITVRDRITLEVREAHARALQAQKNVAAWQRDIIPPLEHALTLAEKAYQAGDITFLQILDTTRTLMDARRKLVETNAEFERALAELDRSAGRSIALHD